jgi:hypothetical protein
MPYQCIIGGLSGQHAPAGSPNRCSFSRRRARIGPSGSATQTLSWRSTQSEDRTRVIRAAELSGAVEIALQVEDQAGEWL